MLDLTFGEQVKIVLSRKGMTIKELAEQIEEVTGKKMSRQNLTQRLGRDNFQEQDMRMIAKILDCPLHLSILDNSNPLEKTPKIAGQEARVQTVPEMEREVTIGELLDINEGLDNMVARAQKKRAKKERSKEERSGTMRELKIEDEEEDDEIKIEETETLLDDDFIDLDSDDEDEEVQPLEDDWDEDSEAGEINPYTGHEYRTNSVRMHPDRIGYVQVYDRADHRWTDMTEWAFLGYQERKKALLGKDYVPPIYLD